MSKYTDEYLLQMSEMDALSLNRKDRRYREKLLKQMKGKKTGIPIADNTTSDKLMVSKAELKRMIDSEVQSRVGSMQKTKDRIFSQVTFDIFYIILYTMDTRYGFRNKRIKDLSNNLFEVYTNAFNGTSSMQEIRDEINAKFKGIFEPQEQILSQAEQNELYLNFMEACYRNNLNNRKDVNTK